MQIIFKTVIKNYHIIISILHLLLLKKITLLVFFNCNVNFNQELFLLQTEMKTMLPNFIVTEAGKSVLFKEWDLVVDEEDEVCFYNLMK